MPPKRIINGVKRQPTMSIFVDGRPINAHPGETIAAAMLANGIFRSHTAMDGEWRGVYCNMGVCFDCSVSVVDSSENIIKRVRSCLEQVSDGMHISTGQKRLEDTDRQK